MSTVPSKKILIVDDEKSLVEFIDSVLAARGHKVTFAYDGQEALRKLLSHGDPDLMLLDMTMPKMGGVQVYSEICTKYGRSRFPVIVLTAMDALTDFFEGALVDKFMTKPFKIKDLLDSVELLLTEEGKPVVWVVDSTPESQVLAGAVRGERFSVKTYANVGESLSGISSPPHYILLECSSAQALESAMRTLKSVEPVSRVPILVYSRARDAQVSASAPAAADAYIENIEDLRAIFTAMRLLQKKKAEASRG